VDAVLHARAFREHRALHRPRCVEAQLALRALLGIDAANQTQNTETQCDGDGHAQDSHGWTSLIGAIMRHSEPAGRYQTMPDRALSTSAHLLTSRATSDRSAALEWTKRYRGRTRGTAEARAIQMRPRVIYDAKPGSPLEVDRELYG